MLPGPRAADAHRSDAVRERQVYASPFLLEHPQLISPT
jgi:hypothetical protein